MPRNKRCRRITGMPTCDKFGPKGMPNIGFINLTLEELETIKLIDNKNMTQEECSKVMNVSRTTVTAIYNDARKKVADALINGKTLIIEGGHYEIIE